MAENRQPGFIANLKNNYYLIALAGLRKSLKGLIGAGLLIIFFGAALLAPFISPYDPNMIVPTARFLVPSLSHPFGTDEYGRDMLSRVIWGSRISLLVGVFSVSISLLGGLILGVFAAYYKGWPDEGISRVIDVLLAFPVLVLAIVLIGIFGPSIPNLILVIGIAYMPQFARVVRAGVLSVAERDYVMAARALGDSNRTIILREILPNIVALMIVQTSITIAFAILSEASLSFIGLGVQPPTPAWGSMLADAQEYLSVAPWMSIFPGAAIFLTVLSFNLFGDGVRDVLDPRLKTG